MRHHAAARRVAPPRRRSHVRRLARPLRFLLVLAFALFGGPKAALADHEVICGADGDGLFVFSFETGQPERVLPFDDCEKCLIALAAPPAEGFSPAAPALQAEATRPEAAISRTRERIAGASARGPPRS